MEKICVYVLLICWFIKWVEYFSSNLCMHRVHSTQKALFFSQLRSRGFLKKNQTALLSPGDKKVRKFHVLVFLLFENANSI